jgi:hypothetical protein
MLDSWDMIVFFEIVTGALSFIKKKGKITK